MNKYKVVYNPTDAYKEEIIIEANLIRFLEQSLVFEANGNLVAIYPANFTVVTKLEI